MFNTVKFAPLALHSDSGATLAAFLCFYVKHAQSNKDSVFQETEMLPFHERYSLTYLFIYLSWFLMGLCVCVCVF